MVRRNPIIAALCLLLAGAAHAAPLKIWAEPPSIRLPATGRLSPGLTAMQPGSITLIAPTRAKVSAVAACQFVLEATDPTNSIDLTTNDFVGPTARIPAEQIALYLERPVTAENFPPWFLRMFGPTQRAALLDALIPLNAPARSQPFHLAAGRHAVIWFEVRIPPNTPAGRFKSSLTVRRQNADAQLISIALDVLAIQLPAPAAPFILAELDDDAAPCAALLRDHGLTPFPAKGAAPAPPGLRPFIAPTSPDALNPTQDDYNRFREFSTHAHRTARDLRVIATLIPQSMRPYGWFDHEFSNFLDAADVLAPPAQFNHAPTLREARAKNRATWLVPDHPPFSGTIALAAPATAARALPWQAWRDGHEAVWLRHLSLAPPTALDRPLNLAAPFPGPFLAYPGAVCGMNDPIPSLRLKQLQQGAQETALLNHLANLGRAETARLLATSLIKDTGTGVYVDNFEDGELARRCENPLTWDRAVEIALAESTPDKPTGADRGDWERFLAATRGIEVWPESVRITLDPSAESYHLDLAVGVRNDTRAPVTGQVRLAAPPQEWNLRKPTAALDALKPNNIARLAIAFGTPHIPADAFGHGRVNLTFESIHPSTGVVSGRVNLAATIAAIGVPAAARTITIDANLADWPLAEHNIAGDFLPISDTPLRRVTRSGAAEAPSAPANSKPQGDRTLVFLSRDADNLYLAIKCRGQPPRPNTPRSTNVVYEELTPRAEDLVEVLIDPTNIAAEPADLYHLVLKSSGAFIAERGIALPRRIGPTKPWPAPIRYAVNPTPDGWIAEAAIPLASLGPPPKPGQVWGINFTRLDPSRGEYSNWAWAPRHCFNPRTLGRLLWPADAR